MIRSVITGDRAGAGGAAPQCARAQWFRRALADDWPLYLVWPA